ncbi:hypothetical protein FB451DRAFT_102284 [Mycena latifolia]|nr:hypothetical protein FB451DRAFT_102284 [Mycena latifolia]
MSVRSNERPCYGADILIWGVYIRNVSGLYLKQCLQPMWRMPRGMRFGTRKERATLVLLSCIQAASGNSTATTSQTSGPTCMSIAEPSCARWAAPVSTREVIEHDDHLELEPRTTGLAAVIKDAGGGSAGEGAGRTLVLELALSRVLIWENARRDMRWVLGCMTCEEDVRERGAVRIRRSASGFGGRARCAGSAPTHGVVYVFVRLCFLRLPLHLTVSVHSPLPAFESPAPAA